MARDPNMALKDWQILEGRVRRVASYLFDAPALPEHINGVNVDAVAKRAPDHWVCIEITTSRTLEKLRADLAKFATIRPMLFAKDIYAKCIFVCDEDPPPSLRESGDGQHVEVLSVYELERQFFDFVAYDAARRRRPFGSAVNPVSGQKDESPYVPVKYSDDQGTTYGIPDIAGALMMGKKVILLGEYGTGKSRSFRELFSELAKHATGAARYPIAIDLRENWGMKRGHEIVRRHLEELGLSSRADAAAKVLEQGTFVFMLDGFDEVGSQAWSTDQQKLRQIRTQALMGARDLITRSGGGVIISGREHYFNSDEEMFAALGIDEDTALVLRCAREFTTQEMEVFLQRIGADIVLPEWLPRRPLICQTIANLEESELDRMFAEEGGDVEFWYRLIDVVCVREARIAPPLVPENIKQVLRCLARATRNKQANVGPLTMTEVTAAFEAALGFPPVEDSAVMLNRLFPLGRITAESSDRQFIDVFILDGLRALDLEHVVRTPADGCENEAWSNPLQRLGQRVAAGSLKGGSIAVKNDTYKRHAKRCAEGRNRVLASDIVGTLMVAAIPGAVVDFEGLRINDGHLSFLDLSSAAPRNLNLTECVVHDLFLPTVQPDNVALRNCLVGTMHGVASATGVPTWVDAAVDRFETVSTVAQIRSADMTANQRILVTIIKKTFFQKGAGRKEEALLRGLGATPATADPSKVLNLLIHEKVLEPHKASGGGGMIYVPSRSLASRMRRMISELTLSRDDIWLRVSELK